MFSTPEILFWVSREKFRVGLSASKIAIRACLQEQESPLGILTGHSDPPHP